MEGKNLNEFIDDLYYNAEIEFVLNNARYLISCWIDNDEMYTLSLCLIGENPAEIFNCTSKYRSEVVETFMNAKIFDDKTFYDVENDIVVMYG